MYSAGSPASSMVIERGIITPSTKQRLEELEAERAHLQTSPAEAPLPASTPTFPAFVAIW
jgi:hypothetical protein